MQEFARRGYYGTPTADIAKAAGISQAYLFRLFPTKQELFVASTTRCFETRRRVRRAPRRRTPATPTRCSTRWARTTSSCSPTATCCSASSTRTPPCARPAVRDAVRRGYGELVELVQRVTGADDEELRGFFAMGMLLNVIDRLGAHELDEPWARALTDARHDAGLTTTHRLGPSRCLTQHSEQPVTQMS